MLAIYARRIVFASAAHAFWLLKHTHADTHSVFCSAKLIQHSLRADCLRMFVFPSLNYLWIFSKNKNLKKTQCAAQDLAICFGHTKAGGIYSNYGKDGRKTNGNWNALVWLADQKWARALFFESKHNSLRAKLLLWKWIQKRCIWKSFTSSDPNIKWLVLEYSTPHADIT